MVPVSNSTVKNQYRTTSTFQWEDRRLMLRGGPLDGRSWVAVVGVGKRIFCGDGPWSTAGVYLVTAETGLDGEGRPASIAVPAFATESATGVRAT